MIIGMSRVLKYTGLRPKNIHKEGLIMANQTLPLNVSDGMKSDNERQNCVGMESGEELCSSSSDTAEELYSSSELDTCGDGLFAVKER